jgi:hypothetical protein
MAPKIMAYPRNLLNMNVKHDVSDSLRKEEKRRMDARRDFDYESGQYSDDMLGYGAN